MIKVIKKNQDNIVKITIKLSDTVCPFVKRYNKRVQTQNSLNKFGGLSVKISNKNEAIRRLWK